MIRGKSERNECCCYFSTNLTNEVEGNNNEGVESSGKSGQIIVCRYKILAVCYNGAIRKSIISYLGANPTLVPTVHLGRHKVYSTTKTI